VDNNNSVNNTTVVPKPPWPDSGLIPAKVDLLHVAKANGVNGQLPSNTLSTAPPVSRPSGSKEDIVLEILVSNQLEHAKSEVVDVNMGIGTPLAALTSRMSEGIDDKIQAVTQNEKHNLDVGAEGEVDEDAEGIADEDAEGDLDAEGEWDEDAEGEPDDGIDYS